MKSFYKTRHSLLLTEIDECSSGLHDCSSHAKCYNLPGSFKCFCNKGYTGDGVRCSGICQPKDPFKGIKILVKHYSTVYTRPMEHHTCHTHRRPKNISLSIIRNRGLCSVECTTISMTKYVQLEEKDLSAY